ncbi:hypothetical protein RSAG8_06090, partial [Rhizoctonia solani AG-8 WAC10335]
MAVASGDYSRAIFVKRKRVDEPMDALMIDLPSQTKRYRGAGEGRGMFTLAETMTEDPSLLDDQRAKDLHKRLAMINQEPRASPKVSSPVAMVMSPPGVPRSAPPPTREYKVLRAARAPSSAVTSNTAPSTLATSAETATTHAPAPIPIPGQRQPSNTPVASSKKPVEEDDDEVYVWDVFYQGPNLSGDLSIWDGLANVGTLSGLPPTDGDILADEEDSDSVKDEADEDSNGSRTFIGMTIPTPRATLTSTKVMVTMNGDSVCAQLEQLFPL